MSNGLRRYRGLALCGVVAAFAAAVAIEGCSSDDNASGGNDASADQTGSSSGSSSGSSTSSSGSSSGSSGSSGSSSGSSLDSGHADASDSGAPDVVSHNDAGDATLGDSSGGGDSSLTDGSRADSSPADSGLDGSVTEGGSTEAGDTGAVAEDGGAEGGDAASIEPGPGLDGGVCNLMWPDGGTNLIADPGFESLGDAGSGWTAAFTGTASVSSTVFYCGAHSGELSGRTVFSQALFTNVTTTPGTYNVAVSVLQDGKIQDGGTTTNAEPITFGGVCTPSDGGAMTFPGGTVIVMASPNQWTFLSGQLTIPVGCGTMQFFVGQPSSATEFPDLFVDEAFFGQ